MQHVLLVTSIEGDCPATAKGTADTSPARARAAMIARDFMGLILGRAGGIAGHYNAILQIEVCLKVKDFYGAVNQCQRPPLRLDMDAVRVVMRNGIQRVATVISGPAFPTGINTPWSRPVP